MSPSKTGLWLIGAKGGVATTVLVGLLALRRQTAGTTGLVSELPLFQNLGLVGWDDIVVGGHDIRAASLTEGIEELHRESRLFDNKLMDAVAPELASVEANLRPGIVLGAGSKIQSMCDWHAGQPAVTAAEAVARIGADLQQFAERHELERVVVVNLSSTEPPLAAEMPATWEDLEPMLNDPSCPLPASSLYAIAAFMNKMAYVNFTPSVGSNLPALEDLALLQGVCHMGRDGKTGETLLKSTLAPMFAARNLEVMSWVGHNIFGNRDGQVLDDPVNKQTKVTSKDQLLGQILGYHPQTLVSIEYIRSLGDWKTAWDHIHFRGFLDTPMIMQFTWQGCDSLLAAPLVIDLFRFTELSLRRSETGWLDHLACFFKSPAGTAVSSTTLSANSNCLKHGWPRCKPHPDQQCSRQLTRSLARAPVCSRSSVGRDDRWSNSSAGRIPTRPQGKTLHDHFSRCGPTSTARGDCRSQAMPRPPTRS